MGEGLGGQESSFRRSIFRIHDSNTTSMFDSPSMFTKHVAAAVLCCCVTAVTISDAAQTDSVLVDTFKNSYTMVHVLFAARQRHDQCIL